MAAISSISNGEALSSVRTKLNSVITEINILDPTDWVDYSATSTIVGWSSFTTKKIRYRVIGKQIFVFVQISGTSNSATTTFTLPFNAANTGEFSSCSYTVNNGTIFALSSYVITANSNVLSLSYWNGLSSGVYYTASGTKTFYGQFNFEIV